jgi:hypothetical protein
MRQSDDDFAIGDIAYCQGGQPAVAATGARTFMLCYTGQEDGAPPVRYIKSYFVQFNPAGNVFYRASVVSEAKDWDGFVPSASTVLRAIDWKLT